MLGSRPCGVGIVSITQSWYGISKLWVKRSKKVKDSQNGLWEDSIGGHQDVPDRCSSCCGACQRSEHYHYVLCFLVTNDSDLSSCRGENIKKGVFLSRPPPIFIRWPNFQGNFDDRSKNRVGGAGCIVVGTIYHSPPPLIEQLLFYLSWVVGHCDSSSSSS